MSEKVSEKDGSHREIEDFAEEPEGATQTQEQGHGWRRYLGLLSPAPARSQSSASTSDGEGIKGRPAKWSLGVLNDKSVLEVPGR